MLIAASICLLSRQQIHRDWMFVTLFVTNMARSQCYTFPAEMGRISYTSTRTIQVHSTYSYVPQKDVFLQFRQRAESTTLKIDEYSLED
jgi:hypothetical protein